MQTAEIQGVRTGKTCGDISHLASGTDAARARPQPTAGGAQPGEEAQAFDGQNYWQELYRV